MNAIPAPLRPHATSLQTLCEPAVQCCTMVVRLAGVAASD